MSSKRVRVRVISEDGSYRGSYLDLASLAGCPHWTGNVRNRARQVLYAVAVWNDDFSKRNQGDPVLYLVELALEPVLEWHGPEDAIDLASIARKLSAEVALIWGHEEFIKLPESLANLLKSEIERQQPIATQSETGIPTNRSPAQESIGLVPVDEEKPADREGSCE